MGALGRHDAKERYRGFWYLNTYRHRSTNTLYRCVGGTDQHAILEELKDGKVVRKVIWESWFTEQVWQHVRTTVETVTPSQPDRVTFSDFDRSYKYTVLLTLKDPDEERAIACDAVDVREGILSLVCNDPHYSDNFPLSRVVSWITKERT